MKQRILHMMGTVIDLQVETEQESILDELEEQLKIYEHRFSANASDSELMAINHQAGKQRVKVHPELFELIELGKTHSLSPNSFLNIAIGPLIQKWRIGFDDAKELEVEEVAGLLKLTDPNKIQLDENTQRVFLEEEGMSIDLGSLAKGYITDSLIQWLKKHHISRSFINLGGNLKVLGPSNREDERWRIGIQDPFSLRGELRAIVSVKEESVVTSGIYERKLKVGEKTYHHIFNPTTGFPIETNILSLTIVSPKSVDGEIWTTKLFGEQPDKIIEVVESVREIECLIVTKTGIKTSRGLANRVIIL